MPFALSVAHWGGVEVLSFTPMMSDPNTTGDRLLVRRAEVLFTMDADRREIPGGSILLEGDNIARVGSDAEVACWIAENAPARTPDRMRK